jgi:hypothetical protein
MGTQPDYILIDRRRWILRKRDEGAWTGLIWLRIGTGGIYQIAVTKNARNFLHLNQ